MRSHDHFYKECIARATFGIEEDLSDGDMVIIKTPNADDAIYLYFEHGWIDRYY